MKNDGTGRGIPETYGFGWRSLVPRLDKADERALLTMGDHAGGQGSRAGRVSAILGLAYGLDGNHFDPGRLSVVDRAAALFSVAFRFGTWPARFVCKCTACGAGNELRVAPEEFAYTTAKAYLVHQDKADLMQPNGYHECLIETGEVLAARDLLLTGPEPEDETAFQTLAEAGPDFAASLLYKCMACGAENHFWFDPLGWIANHLRGLLQEVHELARTYGWTEDQILALPQVRRKAYIRLIAEGQGA